MTTPAGLPDPRSTPFLDVESAGRFAGLGRSTAYEQCRRYLTTSGAEGLPCVSFGRTLRVPTAALWKLAGLEPPTDLEREPAPESPNPGAEVLSLTNAATAEGRARGST